MGLLFVSMKAVSTTTRWRVLRAGALGDAVEDASDLVVHAEDSALRCLVHAARVLRLRSTAAGRRDRPPTGSAKAAPHTSLTTHSEMIFGLVDGPENVN